MLFCYLAELCVVERGLLLILRSCMMQYHPDMNKGPGAEEKFKEIGAAYEVSLYSYGTTTDYRHTRFESVF